jgi:long-subunit fatty acid transport protein
MKKLKLLSILFTIIFSTAALAQNYNDALRLSYPGLGSNARALGMGNAYIALSDDASAMFFNPAGLGLLKRLELSGGIDYFSYNNNATFFNTTEEYSNSQTELNRVSFAFPFPTTRGSLVFGLSYHQTRDLTTALKFDAFNSSNTSKIQSLINPNSPVDLQTPYLLYLSDSAYNTPINGNLQQSGDVLSSGSIGNWTFSGAVEAARNFFIGGNLNIITGSYRSSSNYYEEDLFGRYQGQTEPTNPNTVDFREFYLNNILDWDLSGWNAKLGFIYQMEKVARIGASIQFPKSFNVKEKYSMEAYSRFAGASGTGVQYDDAYEDEIEYDITSPFEFSSGFALNYSGFILSAEATFLDYTQIEFSGEGSGLNAKDIDDINRDIKELLTPVLNYNVGLEYTIPRVGLRLRGGFMVQPSAFKDDESGFDRKYLTGGIGYLADETIGIDMAYAYGWWDDIGDNYGSNVSRTFQEINVNNFVFTLTYRF